MLLQGNSDSFTERYPKLIVYTSSHSVFCLCYMTKAACVTSKRVHLDLFANIIPLSLPLSPLSPASTASPSPTVLLYLSHVYLPHFPLSSEHQMPLARDNGDCDGWSKSQRWLGFWFLFRKFKCVLGSVLARTHWLCLWMPLCDGVLMPSVLCLSFSEDCEYWLTQIHCFEFQFQTEASCGTFSPRKWFIHLGLLIAKLNCLVERVCCISVQVKLILFYREGDDSIQNKSIFE